MNDAPDLIKKTEETSSVASELFERIRNPFLAGFIISWCIINYQFWLIVFSEASINWKIGIIGDLYPYLSPDWFGKLFLYPTLSTIFLRIISHIYLIMDRGLKAMASPAVFALDEVGFSDHIRLRKKINTISKEIENLKNEKQVLLKENEHLTCELERATKVLEQIKDHAVTLTKEKYIATTELNLAIEISKTLIKEGALPNSYDVIKEMKSDDYRPFKNQGITMGRDVEGQINQLAFNGTVQTPNPEMLIENILASIKNPKQ